MKRSVIAVTAAAVLAVLGCLAVIVYVKSADSRALAGKRAVSVLVATKRIPAGTTGTRIRSAGYVEAVSMPLSSVPVDAISSVPASLDKLVVTSDIAPRQLLLRGSFGAPTTTTGGLALPEGKIAVSVDLQGPVDGFVQPGSKIAIFDSFSTDKSNVPDGQKLSFGKDVHQVTRVLLPRVEVIAVGAKTSSAGGGAGGGAGGAADRSEPGSTPSAASKTLTVAVNQDEAERLIHAVMTGTLYFALLDENSDLKPGPGVNNNNLFP